MSRTHTITCSFAFVLAAALTTTAAHAAQRTFVASFGADTNTAANCSLAAPCRGFAAAQTATDNNGEIIVLDSAGYGGITITKSISIIAPKGLYAGISLSTGGGVTIATAGVNVVLRGLNINGPGGANGINMTAGSKLTVENCVISNVDGNGIFVNAAATVRVTDSIVRDNGAYGIFIQNGANATITRAVVSGHGSFGIYASGDLASTTTIDIADSTIDGNTIGVLALSSNVTAILRVSVRDSRIVRNSSDGLVALSRFGAAVSLSASNNIVSSNLFGITASGAGAKVWASGNTVTDNSRSGFENDRGVFETDGNNAVRNNSLANSGTITVVGTQ